MVDDEFSVEIDAAPQPPPPTDEPWAVVDEDPDEEPPEPEGHVLSQRVSDWIGTSNEFFHGPLPHDVAAVWGNPPMRVEDEATCRVLIAAWSLEGFRTSALHLSALAEQARLARAGMVQARFKAERKRKEGS